MTTLQTYGFADAHSTLIGYQQCTDAAAAALVAQAYADARGEAIEYWLDARDADGELPESSTVEPTANRS